MSRAINNAHRIQLLKAAHAKQKARPPTRVERAPELPVDRRVVWTECVEEARERLGQIQQARMRIAELAIRACGVEYVAERHSASGALTNVREIKRFAEEIGIIYNTLWDWIQVKIRVVDHLPAGQYDESDYGAVIRTRRRIQKGADPARVREIYWAEKNRGTRELRLQNIHSRMLTIHHFFTTGSLDGLDKPKLDDIAKRCDEISYKIREFLIAP